MKLKKFMKTFVVCFALVALLTVSCFATSVESTSFNYGYSIPAGTYVFKSSLDFSMYPSEGSFDYLFSFWRGESLMSGVRIVPSTSFFYLYSQSGNNVGSTVYDENGWVDESYRTITLRNYVSVSDPVFYYFFMRNTTAFNSDSDALVFDLTSIFGFIGRFISGATSSLTTMFWNNNSLTFLGTLAVAGLAFAVAFLIIGLIQRFLHFRG